MGPQGRKWRFRCPSCGLVQSGEDFLALGMTAEEAVTRFAFSCIGRWIPECQDAFTGGPGPCNYAGGELIRIAPVCVVAEGKDVSCFGFADEPLAETFVTTVETTSNQILSAATAILVFFGKSGVSYATTGFDDFSPPRHTRG